MRTFDIESFPETFEIISSLDTFEEQDEAISTCNKVWMQAIPTDRVMVLSDDALQEYASVYSWECCDSDLYRILISLRDEMLKSYDMVEKIYNTRDNDIDAHNDFHDFLLDEGIPEKEYWRESNIVGIVESIMIETDDFDSILDDTFAEMRSSYLLLYGRKFTEEQKDMLLDIITDIINHEMLGTEIKTFKFEEDTTMKANYTKTVEEINAYNEALVVLKTCLTGSDESIESNECVEQFKNNYFNMLADDRRFANTKGKKQFAHELLCELAKVEPRISPIVGSDEAIQLVVENICDPVIESLADIPESKIVYENEEAEGDSTKLKCKIRFTTRIVSFLKNIFRAIGKALKYIAKKAGDVYEWIISHPFTETILSLSEAVAIGRGIGSLSAFLTNKFGIVIRSGGSLTVAGYLVLVATMIVAGGLAWLSAYVTNKIREKFLEHRATKECETKTES